MALLGCKSATASDDICSLFHLHLRVLFSTFLRINRHQGPHRHECAIPGLLLRLLSILIFVNSCRHRAKGHLSDRDEGELIAVLTLYAHWLMVCDPHRRPCSEGRSRSTQAWCAYCWRRRSKPGRLMHFHTHTVNVPVLDRRQAAGRTAAPDREWRNDLARPALFFFKCHRTETGMYPQTSYGLLLVSRTDIGRRQN